MHQPVSEHQLSVTEENQKMCYQVVGMVLFYVQLTASQKEILIQQTPPEILLAPGEIAQIACNFSISNLRVLWYKELQNGSLHGIHQSYEQTLSSHEKYSSKVDVTTKMHSLIIQNVQRVDSGGYYCGLAAYIHSNFGSGTRLIVRDASEPRLSILVPSAPEDAELPPVIPLLCLLSDFTPPWSAVLWDTGEKAEGQMGAGAIDGKGVFSVWSLRTISSEMWKQETTFTCTIKKNNTEGSISATVSKETGNCNYVLYIGLSCIFIILIIQLLILLLRKCPMRAERAVQTRNQILMTQTEYATVRYNK